MAQETAQQAAKKAAEKAAQDAAHNNSGPVQGPHIGQQNALDDADPDGKKSPEEKSRLQKLNAGVDHFIKGTRDAGKNGMATAFEVKPSESPFADIAHVLGKGLGGAAVYAAGAALGVTKWGGELGLDVAGALLRPTEKARTLEEETKEDSLTLKSTAATPAPRKSDSLTLNSTTPTPAPGESDSLTLSSTTPTPAPGKSAASTPAPGKNDSLTLSANPEKTGGIQPHSFFKEAYDNQQIEKTEKATNAPDLHSTTPGLGRR